MEQYALWSSLTEQQRQLLRNAGALQGLPLIDKMSREDLVRMFVKMSSLVDESIDTQPDTGQQSFCSMPKAYPPSTPPAAELSRLALSGLRLGSRHAGKVLIVRTIGHPKSNGGVESTVKDEFG